MDPLKELEETARVLEEVMDERNKQDVRWGQQNHTPSMWLTILGEEFGEVCKAVLEDYPQGYRTELIQVAAVAVAMVECFDRHRRLNALPPA